MYKRVSSSIARGAALAAATISLCTSGWAQTPTIKRIFTTVIKPDRVPDFEAGIKQFNDALSKLGGKRQWLV